MFGYLARLKETSCTPPGVVQLALDVAVAAGLERAKTERTATRPRSNALRMLRICFAMVTR
jgi:hypothetical protein